MSSISANSTSPGDGERESEIDDFDGKKNKKIDELELSSVSMVKQTRQKYVLKKKVFA